MLGKVTVWVLETGPVGDTVLTTVKRPKIAKNVPVVTYLPLGVKALGTA